jgi:predicted secreted protein
MEANSRNAAIVMIVMLVWVAGCGASSEATIRPDDVVVSLSDNGSQVELDQGEILAIKLEANQTTGFWWEVAQFDSSILEQMGSGVYYMDDTEDPPPPGTGGVKVYRFKALSAGETSLEIVLRNSTDEDVASVHIFSLQVAVR